MGTDGVPCVVVGVADELVDVFDSFTVATMPAATSAATMSTTGNAMRTRLTRGHGRSARGSGVGSERGASVVSVSLMSLAPSAGVNGTRPRQRERVGSEEGPAHR